MACASSMTSGAPPSVAAIARLITMRWSLWPCTVVSGKAGAPAQPGMVMLSRVEETETPSLRSSVSIASMRSLSLSRSRAALLSRVSPAAYIPITDRMGARSGQSPTSIWAPASDAASNETLSASSASFAPQRRRMSRITRSPCSESLRRFVSLMPPCSAASTAKNAHCE